MPGHQLAQGLSLQRAHGPVDTLISSLASMTLRESIPVVFIHPVSGTWLRQPQDCKAVSEATKLHKTTQEERGGGPCKKAGKTGDPAQNEEWQLAGQEYNQVMPLTLVEEGGRRGGAGQVTTAEGEDKGHVRTGEERTEHRCRREQRPSSSLCPLVLWPLTNLTIFSKHIKAFLLMIVCVP